MKESGSRRTLKATLVLLGSFAFAFNLGEAVHEFGHYLAHQAYGSTGVGVHLDPFGGSRIVGVSSLPPDAMAVTCAAGPLFNVVLAVITLRLLWGRRGVWLFPLLLWGPLALIQEGVTLSLGLLTPGGDAYWIAAWGVPGFVVFAAGVLFLLSGIALIGWLLPLLDLSPRDPFGRKLTVLAGGMVSYMLVRLVCGSLASPGLLVENSVPAVFSLLLAPATLLLYDPLAPVLGRISEVKQSPVPRSAVALSAALGLGMVLFQIVVLN